jgi:nucleotide-binding universal stress UspA family protein
MRAAVNCAARMALQQVADNCARTSRRRPSRRVVAGAVHATIARVAADDRSDPIVLGAAGEHAQRLGSLAGGTALRLLAVMPAALLFARRRIPAGDPREQLLEHARQLGADCLTLGSPGQSLTGRRPLATFGTVAPQVVSRAVSTASDPLGRVHGRAIRSNT